jgi:hypothetical protein
MLTVTVQNGAVTVASMYLDNVTLRVLVILSIVVFNSYLRFPIDSISKFKLQLGCTYPTPLMLASATRC